MPLSEKYLASNNHEREQNFPAEKRNETETETTKPKVYTFSIDLSWGKKTESVFEQVLD